MRAMAASGVFVLLWAFAAGCGSDATADLSDPGPDPALTAVRGLSRLVTADEVSGSAGACTGEVRSGTGRPVAQATVELKRANAPQYDGVTVQTNANGQFGFDAVPPGQFTISVQDGRAVRTQALVIEAGQVTRVDVGAPATPPMGEPGLGVLEPYLPDPGDLAAFQRTAVDGAGSPVDVRIVYTAIDASAGRIEFTRTIDGVEESVTQCYRSEGGAVYLTEETVGDTVTSYSPGLPIFSSGDEGDVVATNVDVSSGGTTTSHRAVLTVLPTRTVTVQGVELSATGCEVYVTELGVAAPDVTITRTWYVPSCGAVRSERTPPSGSGVVEELVTYTAAP
ncbi:MAG TPA: carboxypeptidase-like regulatory domain-containing protein [Armatimonadota bacterium]|mgnify:CR=1 FL=1|nr:carboxypeptidase-like regulatory domain-containing protein [Armatimonadota bacterium]HQK92170.1 carboxypeptidase-like regulatory domain-containing protein [Armatimonadota bacterium]